MFRRVLSAAAPRLTGGGRGFSSLPKDLQEAAGRARYPARRARAQAGGEAAASEGAAGAAAGEGAAPLDAAAQKAKEAASARVQGARIATDWMFPWERRQMAGDGKLKTWEKLYWGVFVGGMALLLFNNLAPKRTPEDSEEEKERKIKVEEAKRERARAVLAGASFASLGEDPFEGLDPEQIAAYVAEAAGEGTSEDPFEGMSPEEINDYAAKMGINLE